MVAYTIFALNLNTNQQITCNFNLFIQKPSSHWRQQPSPTGGTTVLLFSKAVPSLSQCLDHKGRRLEHPPWSASCPASLAERTRWGTGFVLSWKLERDCRTAGTIGGDAQMRATVNSSLNVEFVLHHFKHHRLAT